MLPDVAGVRSWLQSRWSVTAPEDWVEACLTWIQEENQGRSMGAQDVRNAVYEQWLLSDLRELETPCLPRAVSQQEKYLLRGQFALQVDSLVDVGTPYYSQLQKLTGKENANAAVSATQATQPTQNKWEPKSSRMLMLRLTDGCQDVQGMEYESIPCLNTGLLPGCKIIVQGEVLCRLGVLMLKASNLRILGGEVEALAEENTAQRTLEKALNTNSGLAENLPPPQRREFAPTTSHQRPTDRRQEGRSSAGGGGDMGGYQSAASVPNIKSDPGRGRQQAVVARNVLPEEDSMSFPDDDLDHLGAAALDAMEQEWDDDVDYEAVMEQLDSPQPSTSYLDKLPPSNHGNGQQPPPEAPPSPAPREWSPDPDELEAMEAMEEMEYQTTSRANVPNHRPLPQAHETSAAKPSAVSTRLPISSLPDKKPSLNSIPIKPEPLSPMGQSRSLAQQKSQSPSLCGVTAVKTEVPSSASGGVKRETKPKSTVGAQQRLDAFFGNKSSAQKDRGVSDVTEAKKARLDTKMDVMDTDVACLDSKQGVMDTDGVRENRPTGNQMELSSLPWTYLTYVIAAYPCTRATTVRIKGYISTLVSRLEHNNGSHWSLVVKINDGTAAMDVDLSNQLLTELIGFTAAESCEMKKKAKQDLQVRQRLGKGIKGCQQIIVSLSCILELQLIPGQGRPSVTRKFKVTPQDLLQLRNRVSV